METQSRGPIEDKELPQKLEARVVTQDAAPQVHGYDVHEDLARHYGFADLVLLGLTGELPSAETSRAFEVALTFAAPVSVAEAPAHAAVVARVCGPRVASVVGVAALGLAEQAREILDRHDHLLPKLAIGSLNGSAQKVAPKSAEERAAVERFRAALGSFCARVPTIGYDVGLDTAILATLIACGLTSRERLEVALTCARLPLVCAEALTWKPGDLRRYPMNLPRFVYDGGAS